MPTWRRTQLAPGLYDEPVSEHLAAQLEALGPHLQARLDPLPAGSSALRAWLVEALELALQAVPEPHEPAFAHELLALLQRHAPKAFARPAELRLAGQRLDAIHEPQASAPTRPRGSLHAASLLVNAAGERLVDHLRSEFDSADRIDLLCAFIKLSGVEKLRAELERHCSGRGRTLRVLTTTYMGASDAKAIERLAALPNVEVKVSYDEAATRLHAKAWIFHRESGYSTAYLGSSNLSHAAQTDGLEWNVRLAEQGQPALVEQMRETFEQYWADPYQFESYRPDDETHRIRLARALGSERFQPGGLLVEIEPKDYQRPILDELVAARALGRHRNLLVAATGTGKTVMAALDYARLRREGVVETLLFVAHRREILEQARLVFRNVLQQAGFGELRCDGIAPDIDRHVFASIQSLLNAPPDPTRFDLVIIDEAHHTSAGSWDQLLRQVRPKQLLGLTGTPERADGLDYEQHFPRPWIGNLRVWNAIPQALVPFRYYLLHVDGIDLADVRWSQGRYAPEELSGQLIDAAEIHVRRAIQALVERIARPEQLRALAFCANIAHAQAIDRQLRRHDLRSMVLTGATASQERRQARSELDDGRIQVLCVIDIYNEGVDVPNVNTLFFFRPTESATVFLQQLGRGLRRAPGKAELVVFDLTGRQHHAFRFDRKLRGLLGHTPRELREYVEHGHGRLPSGCHLHFDELAREQVLQQIQRAIPADRRGIVQLLREPAHAELTLDQFLLETDVALDDIYRKDSSWTLLHRAAGLHTQTLAAGEDQALRQVCKLIHVGDHRRLDAWQQLLDHQTPSTEADHRLQRMLYAVLYGKADAATDTAAQHWQHHPVLRAEIAQLLPVLRRLNALLPSTHQLEPDVPLVLHAQYLGVELSVAFDNRAANRQFRDYYTGVEAVADGRYDLLLVTLHKSAATLEHLRYRDFPLSEREFHWQSKIRTTVDSREGRRHLRPEEHGMRSLLLVREQADRDSGVTMAFRYLGPVRPLRHHGERPVTVEWGLDYAMPGVVVRGGRVAA